MLHGRALELQLEAILQACTCTGHSTALDKKRSSAKPCGSYCQQRREPCFVRPQISQSAGAAALQKKRKVEPTKQVQVRDRGTPWANIGHMPQVELETLEEVSTRPKAPNGPVGIEEMNSCAALFSCPTGPAPVQFAQRLHHRNATRSEHRPQSQQKEEKGRLCCTVQWNAMESLMHNFGFFTRVFFNS